MENLYSCVYCPYTNIKQKSVSYHTRYCKMNPEKIEMPPKSKTWYESMSNSKNRSNQYIKDPEKKMSEETKSKLKDLNTGRKHKEETKKKISEARIKYLVENPDKVPYKLNHYSNGRSYPEAYFKGVFDALGVNYVEQYSLGLYTIDFAIPDKKIAIEIDGDHHVLDKRVFEKDIRRDATLLDKGWTTKRILWSDYQKKERSEKENFIKNFLIGIIY